VTDASGLSAKISYRDYLQYFLYGGMVYMALKDWRKALHFLGVVISTPVATYVSLVMVDAYKKWVLVGLLEHGKVRKLNIDHHFSSDSAFLSFC
jgi:COP9 signalosome complex subunit 3